MSYRRSAREILDSVESERQYAKRIHKVIYPSLETIKLEQDPHVSFWGLPKEEFWKVVPQLLEAAEGDPAIGGVMIHCYRGLVERFRKDRPKKPVQTPPNSFPPEVFLVGGNPATRSTENRLNSVYVFTIHGQGILLRSLSVIHAFERTVRAA